MSETQLDFFELTLEPGLVLSCKEINAKSNNAEFIEKICQLINFPLYDDLYDALYDLKISGKSVKINRFDIKLEKKDLGLFKWIIQVELPHCNTNEYYLGVAISYNLFKTNIGDVDSRINIKTLDSKKFKENNKKLKEINNYENHIIQDVLLSLETLLEKD